MKKKLLIIISLLFFPNVLFSQQYSQGDGDFLFRNERGKIIHAHLIKTKKKEPKKIFLFSDKIQKNIYDSINTNSYVSPIDLEKKIDYVVIEFQSKKLNFTQTSKVFKISRYIKANPKNFLNEYKEKLTYFISGNINVEFDKNTEQITIACNGRSNVRKITTKINYKGSLIQEQKE